MLKDVYRTVYLGLGVFQIAIGCPNIIGTLTERAAAAAAAYFVIQL